MSVFDPRLMANLGPQFPETCTIQRYTETVDDNGEVTKTWTALHEDVSCSCMPTGGKEVKTSDRTYVIATHSIALQGSYTDVTEMDRVVMTDVTYDVLLAEQTLDVMTTLLCEVVR